MLNKHVRFGCWTDEEQGLNGSQFYANALPAAERTKIKGYFNFDMVASTNGGYFINRTSPAHRPGPEGLLRHELRRRRPRRTSRAPAAPTTRSFNAVGIQTSGVAAGAEPEQDRGAGAAKWGGTAGRRSTPCYHRSCDTYRPTSATRCSTAPATRPRTRCGRWPRRRTAGDDRLLGHLRDRRPAGPPTRRHRHRHHRRAGSAATRPPPPPAAPSSSAPPSAASTTWSPARPPGTSAGDYDVDGGVTTIQSPPSPCPPAAR